MAVDRGEHGHVKGVRWNLPGKAHADEDVGLVASEQRRDTLAPGRDDDVELGRRVPEERVERVPVAPGMLARAQERDGLVPCRREERREPLHCLGHLRDEDDSQPRSNSRMRSQSVTTLSKSACSVCA